MSVVITVMSVILVVACVALAFCAYQARREQLPGGEWVGNVIDRANEAVPVIRDGDLDPGQESAEDRSPHHATR